MKKFIYTIVEPDGTEVKISATELFGLCSVFVVREPETKIVMPVEKLAKNLRPELAEIAAMQNEHLFCVTLGDLYWFLLEPGHMYELAEVAPRG